MSKIEFIDNNGTFKIKQPENYSYLYFPIAGENGIKANVTPNLGGDSKLDQNHFLLEPESTENLHNNKSTRNFWCNIEGKGIWSVVGSSAKQESEKFTDAQDESEIEAGFMWHKLTRSSKEYGVKAETTSFVTISGDVEVALVEITNENDEDITFTPVAAIPIYGRSADNIRDHRHVTSLLHRTKVTENGVMVRPVLSFDERGHQKNDTTYFVIGKTADGKSPVEFYPTVEEFLGEGGSFANPMAVRTDAVGKKPGDQVDGRESVGAFKFEKTTLSKYETASYIILLGATNDGDNTIEDLVSGISTKEDVLKELEEIKKYWTQKVNVSFSTGNKESDNYLKWICFQPILRRIYGCSFLPYHDYGKGGRGWRDLWQDCLALLIMEPYNVRKMIVDNYCGVRIDGTNATIIGSKQGEFIADRNNITRVWMDHAFWPFITTQLYINQTGDLDILMEKVPYFKDLQSKRGTAHDNLWKLSDGNNQKTEKGEIYFGTLIEHILLQNLCAFYDVGEHNEIKLRGADWNDALDMAADRGESVAFTCAYAGNLAEIASLLRGFQEETKINKIELAEEILVLLKGGKSLYDSIDQKVELLDEYVTKCEHNISGKKVICSVDDVCRNLEEKSNWLMENIRNNEWVTDGEGNGWFNGYYDNSGKKVEGVVDGNVRMMLTGQVFAIMSRTAEDKQVKAICKSADKYLYDKNAGGYRLNTDFKEEKFDLGRMFGFAYGEKENGAVFSHMAVMYANALYQRGYAEEGNKVLKTLLDTAKDFDRSKMYPGIPEYFDINGRGMYSYLTGAASWYILTVINEVFGVKGEYGDMVIEPRLLPEQFGANKVASFSMQFAGKNFDFYFYNEEKIKCHKQKIKSAKCDNFQLSFDGDYKVRLSKEIISNLSSAGTHVIEVKIS